MGAIGGWKKPSKKWKKTMLNQAIHKKNLVVILKDIYADQAIAPFLGFKGGTAAYLFYGLDRFSVDLDFNLLDPQKEEMVFEKIKKIISTYGQTKEAHKKHYTLFFLLSYQTGLQNIKIEISRRASVARYENLLYLGIPMKVMAKEDMAAHKLLAMFDRLDRCNRDIYDVWFFLKNNWPVNKQIIEQISGKKFKVFTEECIVALEKTADSDILSGMGELLNNKQKDWARINLRKDAIFQLKLLIS